MLMRVFVVKLLFANERGADALTLKLRFTSEAIMQSVSEGLIRLFFLSLNVIKLAHLKSSLRTVYAMFLFEIINITIIPRCYLHSKKSN